MPEQPERALARWLVSLGYPWDVTFPGNQPPVDLGHLAEAWREQDGLTESDADTVADYRQWLEMEIADADA